MAVLFNLFILSCFTLLCFTINTTSLATTSPTITKPKRLVTQLIHHNSVYSPYYNPKDTIADRARHAIDSSNAHFDYIWKEIQGVSLETDDVRSNANISIGSPPVPQLLTMDTGSSLSWTQCQPCMHCFTQALPIFNPPQSATYRLLPCSSPICQQAPSMICPASRCEFELQYGDGTVVSGYLGTEKITFETSDEGITSVPNLVVGCAYDVRGNWRTDGGQSSGLIIGDGARIEGPSTPITIFGGYYYVTLESISVGEKKLDISPKVFKVTQKGTDGVIIDSVVAFTFANGVDLALDEKSFFYPAESKSFCMAMVPSTAADLTLIGVLAQQSYNIAYDLVENTVSIQRIDCALLE
uniref:Peptidase A1 domain-containing protein n=1 Tax=Quercus lobata TaxID=97700 RepID=A0A7N2MKT5_QUELO